MGRVELVIAFFVVIMLFVLGCTVAAMPMVPYSYTQNFEENDPIKVGSSATASKYQINFKGLTSERKTDGEKAFKLDLTFTDDATVSWRLYLPALVPAEGRLQFTGKMYIDEQTTAKLPGAIRSGPMFNYPPSTVKDSSNGIRSTLFEPTVKGQWITINQDVVYNAHRVTNLSLYDWGNPTVDNVAPFMSLYFVTVVGKKGERIVLYLDGFHIDGEVPVVEDYEAEMAQRWEPIKAKIESQLQTWEQRLAEAKRMLVSTSIESAAQNSLAEVAALISQVEQDISGIRTRGAMTNTAAESCEASITQVENLVARLAASANVQQPIGMVITTTPAISSVPIMAPKSTAISDMPGQVSDKVELTATPGEYEPASFIVNAIEDIVDLELRVSDLIKDADIIESRFVDVKIVKRWYQAGSAWQGIKQKEPRVLVPELLVNDDTLVKVDHEKQENYLKLSFPDETKYVWISDPDEAKKRYSGTPPESTILSFEEFPVKDSPVLLPVSISAGDNRQFWLTVHVPDEAAPGLYTGRIELYSAGEKLAELQLNLNVLPFKLLDPYYESSLYYRGKLNPTGEGTISSELKSAAQMKLELENMIAHGVTNPRARVPAAPWNQGLDLAAIEAVLKIRDEVNLSGKPLHLTYGYNLGFDTTIISTPQRLNALKTRVSEELLPLTRKYGIPEVYIYGIDEARGERVTMQIPAWRAIQEAGAKVETSGFLGQFKLAGDVLDTFIHNGYLNKEEADQWHAAGRKIMSYANPQVGVENPEIYRRNYGLMLWKYGYDGASTWTYHMSFGNIWNDFDHEKWRDHNFTYPTVDGVIDTIAWEGYREGVDDVRYLTTLLDYIKKAQSSDNNAAKEVAVAAEEYLETLKMNLEQRDMYDVRKEIIDWILELVQLGL